MYIYQVSVNLLWDILDYFTHQFSTFTTVNLKRGKKKKKKKKKKTSYTHRLYTHTHTHHYQGVRTSEQIFHSLKNLQTRGVKHVNILLLLPFWILIQMKCTRKEERKKNSPKMPLSSTSVASRSLESLHT